MIMKSRAHFIVINKFSNRLVLFSIEAQKNKKTRENIMETYEPEFLEN